MLKKPSTRPIIGESTMNWAILTKPLVITACGPDEIHAAPTKPPISAWDDDVGSPSHQVMRFQITAPRTPAKIIMGVTTDGSTTPFPTVFATCTPKTAKAAKLKNPAHTTAIRGDST